MALSRVREAAYRESFRVGAQHCREMMARFVEQGGDPVTAASIRANWSPSWGPDPGRLRQEDEWGYVEPPTRHPGDRRGGE